MIYVSECPKQIGTVDGTIYNPTPEQCEAAGYILGVDPQIAVIASQVAAKEVERQRGLQDLRDTYADATGQLCRMAGIPVVRVLTMSQVQAVVMQLLPGSNAATVNALLTLMTACENKLCREDGNDALDRV